MKVLIAIFGLGVIGVLVYLLVRKQDDGTIVDDFYGPGPEPSPLVPPMNACTQVVGTAASVYGAYQTGMPPTDGQQSTVNGLAASTCKLAKNTLGAVDKLASERVRKDLEKYGKNLLQSSGKIAINSALYIPKVTIEAGVNIAKSGFNSGKKLIKSLF